MILHNNLSCPIPDSLLSSLPLSLPLSAFFLALHTSLYTAFFPICLLHLTRLLL
jgi:hypothetical protein